MGKEILVNVANRETRIAVYDDNQLVELRIEREEQVVGNIYKGRVENVLPGMDAAFVDIGLERNAFLYVADILPEYVDSDDDEEDEDDEVVAAVGGDDDLDESESTPQAAAPEPGKASISAAGASVSVGTDSALVPAAAPRTPDGGSGGQRSRNRSRRGGRARREEISSGSVAPEPVSENSASGRSIPADDYRQYLTDPDREQDAPTGFDADEEELDGDSSDAGRARAFVDEMSTEDGFDLEDIVQSESGTGNAEPILSDTRPADTLSDDGEIDPGALALARETEEIYEEGLPDGNGGDGDGSVAAAGSLAGADFDAKDSAAEPASYGEALAEGSYGGETEIESVRLDQDAAMLDAAAAANGGDGGNAAAEASGQAEVVRAPAQRGSRPGGRRAGGPGGGGDAGSKPINQSKRPMRRGGSPGGGGGRSGGRGFNRRHASIAELVHTKQELLLQVVKGPRGTKGSRVSTRMSLPGRYLVLMPDANNLGVSRKIEESKERDRLKNVVERFRQPGYGIIVRTEAEGRSASDLYQDYSMLVETWQSVWAKAKTTPAPSLIHQDQSLIYTIMRDVFGSDIDRLVIDSADDYARACEIIDRISPDLTDRIHLYDGERPLFEAYRGVEQDIERLLRRKVWLKSGGYLVIDQTEALTSIDVNTGKFVGSSGSGLSETILQTNMEATGEIARQLRLRDLGGMIVLDFIDMDNQRDKKSVTDALFRALKDDRSRTKIASISPLGLIEMTRKRTKETVDVALTDTCPYCHGIGRVSSAETVSMQAEREIAKVAAEVSSEAILVTAHPDVVSHLVGEQGADIDALERQVRRSIYVRADSDYHIEKYEVEPGASAKIEQHFPLPRRGQMVECQVQKSTLSALPWASAFTDGGYQIELVNGARVVGQSAKIRLLNVARSYAVGEVLGGGIGPIGGSAPAGRPIGQGQERGQNRQSPQQEPQRGGGSGGGNYPRRGGEGRPRQ